MNGATNPARKLAPTIVVIVAIGAICLLFFGVSIVINKRANALKTLDDINTRYSRLIGLKGSQAELEKRSSDINELLRTYSYPVSLDATQAGNTAQQQLRDIFAGAGLDVVSTQVLAAKTEKTLDKIPLLLRVEGPLAGMQSALVVLRTQKPAIFVEGFSLQTVGTVRAEAPQRLGGQFTLYVLKQRP